MKTYANDIDMLQAIRGGDYKAFACFFRTYSPRMRNIAKRFISDENLIDDIVQTCFLNLWEKHTKLPKVESPRTFLFAIVRNGCLNELRRINKEQGKIVSVTEVDDNICTVDAADHPERELLYNELNGEIEGVMENLPPRTREVFTLSRFYGLKNWEIAEREQISIKVVERHIQKALKAFHNHFPRLAM